MSKASDNVFPRLLISEGGSTATPAAARVTIYAKADGLLYSKDDAGAETALGGGGGDITTDAAWAAAGDIIVGTGNNTAGIITKGAAGTVATAGASTLAYAFPPGYELDYVAFTADVAPTATTEATANTIVTGSAITYDGSTPVMIEFFSPNVTPDTSAIGRSLLFYLYDGSSSIGRIAAVVVPAAQAQYSPVMARRRLTPSAASHTYSIRAAVSAGTGAVSGGAGGNAAVMPGYIRITKV